MSTLGERELTALRSGFRADRFYQSFLSERSRRVLDAIIDDPRFPGSTEPPVLAMLGGLLRIIQPERVLQLGTYIGFSAVFIGDVLAHNERTGGLFTVDPSAVAHELARNAAQQADLTRTITFLDGYSMDPATADAIRAAGPFDFIYLDSSHAYEATLAELRLIFEDGRWLSPHGLLVLHDAATCAAQFDPSGGGGVRRALEEWIGARSASYQLLILEPPLWPGGCGLGLLSRRPQ